MRTCRPGLSPSRWSSLSAAGKIGSALCRYQDGRATRRREGRGARQRAPQRLCAARREGESRGLVAPTNGKLLLVEAVADFGRFSNGPSIVRRALVEQSDGVRVFWPYRDDVGDSLDPLAQHPIGHAERLLKGSLRTGGEMDGRDKSLADLGIKACCVRKLPQRLQSRAVLIYVLSQREAV